MEQDWIKMEQDWDINLIEILMDQPDLDDQEMLAGQSEEDGIDSEEDSGDDSDVGRSYRDELDILLKALESELSLNLLRQQEIDDLLVEPVGVRQKTHQQHVSISKKSMTVFCAPYFKDYRLYSHPKNNDTIKKDENKELDVYISNPTTWTESDKKYLKAAVKENALMKIPSYCEWIRVKEILNHQRKKIGKSSGKREDLAKRIAMAEAEIKNIENLSDECIFSNRDEDFKWTWISLEEFHGIHSAKSCELQWKNQIHPSLNQAAWSRAEDELLKYLTEITGATDWNFIADQLGTDRTPISCMQRYMRKLNEAESKRRWDKSEDEELIKLVEEHRINNLIPWSKIACHMECRAKDKCWQRYFYSLKGDIRRGAFTEEEDMLLIAGVEMYGTDWSTIGSYFTSRTPIQLFSRWNYFLKADFQNWTHQEDMRLWELVQKNGDRDWLKTSKEMTNSMGRCFTNVQVKQRFKTLKLKLGKLKLVYKKGPGLSSIRQTEVYNKMRETFENWSENYGAEIEDYDDNDDHNSKRSFTELFDDVSNIKLKGFMHYIQELISQSTNENSKKQKHDSSRKPTPQFSGICKSRKHKLPFSEEDAKQMRMASQCINAIGDFPNIDATQDLQNDPLQPILDSVIQDESEDIKTFKIERESIYHYRGRDCDDALKVVLENQNISKLDIPMELTNMTLMPPNLASLLGFRGLLLQKKRLDSVTVGAILKEKSENALDGSNKSDQMEGSIELERLSQDEADMLLSRRFVKMFLLPAKMSVVEPFCSETGIEVQNMCSSMSTPPAPKNIKQEQKKKRKYLSNV